MLKKVWDKRRTIWVFDTKGEATSGAVVHFLDTAKQVVTQKGSFSVALCGGQTPKAIYKNLTHPPNLLDWTKVQLFFSDERAVPPTDEMSNFRMAMEAGFKDAVPEKNIFRLEGEKDLLESAQKYQKILQKNLGSSLFDLVTLGMGDDGHTASLFSSCDFFQKGLVTIFDVPKKGPRLSLTLNAINQSSRIVFYVFGKSKRNAVQEIFLQDNSFLPAFWVGSFQNPALWIMDKEAAASLLSYLDK